MSHLRMTAKKQREKEAWIQKNFPKPTVEKKAWRTRGEYLRLRKKAHTRPSQNPPVLISIAYKEGSEMTDQKAKKVGNKYRVTYGMHATVGCWWNWLMGGDEACVRLFYPPVSKLYTRVGMRHFEDDMIKVISHESLHHALMWLADDPLSQTYDQLDNVVDSLQTAKRLGL